MLTKLLSKKNEILVFLIFLLAIFLRFVNFDNRWGLAMDQARDAIIAHQALISFQLPTVGPFSASGPFIFGPYCYWFYVLVTSLDPSSIMFLWIVQAAISACMVLVMFAVAREINGNKFGLLLAFLTTISTGQISQATNLTYSTFAGFISMLVVLVLIKTIKTGKEIYFFLLSFLIALAVNVHFQAVGLLLILFILPFFVKLSPRKILLLAIGFFIPFIPLIIFDFRSNHYESSHLISYFLSGGNKYSLPKRWLTYVGVYWPRALSIVIGGYRPMGYLMGITIPLVLTYSLLKKQVSKFIVFLLVLFGANFVLLRYFKGEIYDSFLVYLHPIILIFTAWTMLVIKRKNIVPAIFLFIFIVSFTFVKDFDEIKNATNLTAKFSAAYVKDLINQFPGQKFSVYDFEHKAVARSFPMVMYLMKDNLISDSGRKIGFTIATDSAELEKYKAKKIVGDVGSYVLLDLDSSDRKILENKDWKAVNPNDIYNDTEKWYFNKENLF